MIVIQNSNFESFQTKFITITQTSFDLLILENSPLGLCNTNTKVATLLFDEVYTKAFSSFIPKQFLTIQMIHASVSVYEILTRFCISVFYILLSSLLAVQYCKICHKIINYTILQDCTLITHYICKL